MSKHIIIFRIRTSLKKAFPPHLPKSPGCIMQIKLPQNIWMLTARISTSKCKYINFFSSFSFKQSKTIKPESFCSWKEFLLAERDDLTSLSHRYLKSCTKFKRPSQNSMRGGWRTQSSQKSPLLSFYRNSVQLPSHTFHGCKHSNFSLLF